MVEVVLIVAVLDLIRVFVCNCGQDVSSIHHL